MKPALALLAGVVAGAVAYERVQRWQARRHIRALATRADDVEALMLAVLGPDVDVADLEWAFALPAITPERGDG